MCFRWLSQSRPSRVNESHQFPSVKARESISLQVPTIGESDFALCQQATEQENSHPDIWGEDANEWNPERFLDPDREFGEASSGIGVFGNLWVYICSSQLHLTDDLLQDELLYAPESLILTSTS